MTAPWSFLRRDAGAFKALTETERRATAAFWCRILHLAAGLTGACCVAAIVLTFVVQKPQVDDVALIHRTSVPDEPRALASSPQMIWVAARDGVIGLRSSTGGPAVDVVLERHPWRDIATWGTKVYVTADDGILAWFDVHSPDRVRYRSVTATAGKLHVAAGPSGIFVASDRHRWIKQISIAARRSAHVFHLPGPVTNLTETPGKIWAAIRSRGGVELLVWTARGWKQRFIAGLPHPVNVAPGAGRVWVVSDTPGALWAITYGGRLDGSINATVGTAPIAVAVGNHAVWITSTGDDSTTEIGTTGRQRVGSPQPAGQEPQDILADDNAIWTAALGDSEVVRLDLKELAALRSGRRPTHAPATRLGLTRSWLWALAALLAFVTGLLGGSLKLIKRQLRPQPPPAVPDHVNEGFVDRRLIYSMAGEKPVRRVSQDAISDVATRSAAAKVHGVGAGLANQTAVASALQGDYEQVRDADLIVQALRYHAVLEPGRRLFCDLADLPLDYLPARRVLFPDSSTLARALRRRFSDLEGRVVCLKHEEWQVVDLDDNKQRWTLAYVKDLHGERREVPDDERLVMSVDLGLIANTTLGTRISTGALRNPDVLALVHRLDDPASPLELLPAALYTPIAEPRPALPTAPRIRRRRGAPGQQALRRRARRRRMRRA